MQISEKILCLQNTKQNNFYRNSKVIFWEEKGFFEKKYYNIFNMSKLQTNAYFLQSLYRYIEKVGVFPKLILLNICIWNSKVINYLVF